MNNKKRLKLSLYILFVICILASFTYAPSDAKYYKEQENAILYKAKFNQMGGYYIDDTSEGMGLQDDSSMYNVHYKFKFARSNDRKTGEVDNYSLTLPNECIVNFDDGNKSVDGTTITFNDSDLNSKDGKVTVNVTCPLGSVTTADDKKINLPINVRQQFTNGTVDERTYDYAIGEYNVDKTKYLEDKIDKLEGNNIYLIKSNSNDIYKRFTDLLKEYVATNNKDVYEELLKDYLVDSKTLDRLLEEYLNSIFINGTATIKVSDLEKISGITLNSNLAKYNQLTIDETVFKAQFKRYFDLRVDRLVDNNIYLSNAIEGDIYNRFVKLLQKYIKSESTFSDGLSDYITDFGDLDTLLDIYLKSIFTTGIENITVTVLGKIEGIEPKNNPDYGQLEITTDFKTYLKQYFDLKDYVVGNNIKISKLNTETVEQRIKNLLDSYYSNKYPSEIESYIKDHLEEEKRETPSEYASIEGLNYSNTTTHDEIIIEPNFSSYAKTYYDNKEKTNRLKNFYFFNENLSSSEINTLFFKYLDAYFYESKTNEYKEIKTYLESKFDATTDNVIALAKKINRDYFSYNKDIYAIQLTSRLYDIIENGESFVIQKSFTTLKRKIKVLKEQLLISLNNDEDIVNAIVDDSNFQNIIKEDSLDAIIDTTITIVSGTNNIELKITSLAGVNEINIKITITSNTNSITNSDISSEIDTITPPIEEEPSEVETPPLEETGETETKSEEEITEEVKETFEDKEETETTNQDVEGDKQTTDEIGIVSYPINALEDNTLGEDKKYMYIKPEDE